MLDFAGIPPIGNVTVDPASESFPTFVTFTSDSVDIAFNGGPEVLGARTTLDVSFVPEPATATLFAAGVALLALSRGLAGPGSRRCGQL